MTATHNSVRVEQTDDPSDIGRLAQVLVDSFHDLAPSKWLVADSRDRAQVFPGFFGLYVEQGMHEGRVWTTPERNAVAVWFPGSAEPPAEHYSRLAAITGPQWFHRFPSFDHTLDGRHPSAPHDWLAVIGVTPDAQGYGVGSALLAVHHQLLDGEGRPAYLEAADLRSRDLYRRHGYRDHGAPIMLPDSGPPMYPMWREPVPHYRFGP